MKKMTSINIDKWRTLTEDLFKGYIHTYKKLSENTTLDPAETLIETFGGLDIKGALTTDGYGSAYTIAREIGVYFEEDSRFVLSNMAHAFINGKLTYSDYLKYYCLNIEFLINDEVIHPFYEVLEILNDNKFDRNEIASRASKLIPDTSNSSAIDCLRLFLNRCVDANLLKNNKGTYSLNYNYNILLGSINVSSYSALEFEKTFIKGDQAKAQKNIVTKLLEREIPNLFKDSFFIKKYLNKESNSCENEEKLNIIELFIEWFIKRDKDKHNYYSNNFSENRERLKKALEEYQEIYYSEFKDRIFSIDEYQIASKIESIEINLNKNEGDFFEFSAKKSNHMPRAILGKRNYLSFLKEYDSTNLKIEQIDFDLSKFKENCFSAGLIYSNQLLTRFVSSLVTKPFVILTGLSGSGKTKLAQSFAQWICESEKQYCIVPVGADWINREPLLGYVNALEDEKYILPENGALELIIRANNNASDAANPDSESELKPYFLILDEMNLSHVERYFADFLSVMESDDTFKLHSSDSSLDGGNDLKVNKEYGWPKNLFVVGTVNIDETTYMFSPKVLDRANVIEFRISSSELNKYFGPETKPLNMNLLFQKGTTIGKGAQFANSFISFEKLVAEKENLAFLNTKLGEFFVALQAVDAEFGYRTASEIQTLYSKIDSVNPTFKDSDEYKEKYSTEEDYKIDIAVMQKLLPKLHGSRSKLVEPLKVLASLCYESSLSKEEKDEIFEKASDIETKLIYPLSLEKITRMYNNVLHNGFTSYAEA